MPPRELLLQLEPSLIEGFGVLDYIKLKKPYTHLSAMEQLVFLSFFQSTGMTVPANDIWFAKEIDRWFY